MKWTVPTWQEYYDYAFEEFLDFNDPDDWAGREADYCIQQDEYACNYADACTDEHDDNGDDDSDDEWGDDDHNFNPQEEVWEVEDMPGGNADERAEAHDNWDWDAADA